MQCKVVQIVCFFRFKSLLSVNKSIFEVNKFTSIYCKGFITRDLTHPDEEKSAFFNCDNQKKPMKPYIFKSLLGSIYLFLLFFLMY